MAAAASGAKAAMQKHLDRVAKEYERDWPLVASERTAVNGRAPAKLAPKRVRAGRR